jgi:hypothetical protein
LRISKTWQLRYRNLLVRQMVQMNNKIGTLLMEAGVSYNKQRRNMKGAPFGVGFECSARIPPGSKKSLRLCLAGLRIRRFDPIAEASELPEHSRGALLLGLFGDRRAPFFVTHSLVQN